MSLQNVLVLFPILVCAVRGNRTCLQGWMKEKDTCYKVFHDKQSWQGASDHCDDLESRLVTLNNLAEQRFILQLRTEDNENMLWIGFYKNHSVWTWLDTNETAINYLDTKNMSHESDCAAITGQGVWIPLHCGQHLPFICETNVTGCPTNTGWIEHDFRCMFILSTPYEWDTARYECNGIGAELAVLNDLKADSFLQSQTTLHDWLWVGLKFDANCLNYTWIDGRKGYVKQVTTSSPYLNGGCGAVGVNHTTRQLISMTTSCSTRLPAVCEKARVTSPPTTPIASTTTGSTVLQDKPSSPFDLSGPTGLHSDNTVPSLLVDRKHTTDRPVIDDGPSLTDDQIGLYNSILNCLHRMKDSTPEDCLDKATLQTSCNTDAARVFAVVCRQRFITADLKVILLKYAMSEMGRLTLHMDSSLFCSQKPMDVLDAMEHMVGNYLMSSVLNNAISLSNSELSMTTVDVNNSSRFGPYYEGELAGCILQDISPHQSESMDGDLKLSVILSTSNNGAVTIDEWEGMDTYYIISAVFTMSAYSHGYRQNVVHTFTLLHTFDMDSGVKNFFYRNTTEILCAFYSTSKRAWSVDGCDVVKTDLYATTCECNHTTSFAVLMKVHTYKISQTHKTALSVITIIGCSVSMITMFISLTVFTCIRSLASERVFVHRNLCLSILFAQVIFLAGIKATYHKMVCRVIAIALHYCYLSVFTWMLVEGLHLYTKVVQVFGTEQSRISYYLVFGWGIPFVLVMISTIADFDGYGTDTSCWLSIYRRTIWAFVGPAVAVMVINVTILIMVLRIVISSVKLDRPRHMDQVLAAIKGTAFLLPLLGLTWIFGLLAINKNWIVFEYVFAICNSLQGFFVFLFHCVFNSEVRQTLQRLRDRQTITIRGETVVYAGPEESDSLTLETRVRNRKTRFLLSGRIRVTPVTDNQAIDNTEVEIATVSL